MSYTQAFKRFKKFNLESDDHRIDKDNLRNIQIAVYSNRVSMYNNNGGHSKLNIRKENIIVKIKSEETTHYLNINDKKAINMKCTKSIAAGYLSACDMLEEISDKYKVHFIKADEKLMI